jgi:hypothetical protein
MTLRVTLEIVPFGDESKKRVIRQLDIFNMGVAAPTEDGWDRGGYYEYGIIDIDHEKNTGGLYEETVLHRRWEGVCELVAKVIYGLILPNEIDNTKKL